MDYGLFADRLAGRGDRWTLLRDFQREWGVDTDDRQQTDPDHVAAQRMLHRARRDPSWQPDPDTYELDGVDLTLAVPRALDEWWLLPYNAFHYNARLYWTHPVYPPTCDTTTHAGDLAPDSPLLDGAADRRVCVFMAEYQYCDVWGYPAAQAARPDPTALVSGDGGWVVQAPTLSEFFLQLAAVRLPRKLGWSLQLADPPPGLATAGLAPLGFRPWRELGGRLELLGTVDAIVYHDRSERPAPRFWAAGRTEQALAELAARLDIPVPTDIDPPRDSRS